MDRRYVADRDRNREMDRRGLSSQAEWEEIYASYDAAGRQCLDDWIAAIVARAHQMGAKNYGPDAARETIIAYLHWEDDRICEVRRQKALEKRYGYRTG